jgi:DNA-binding transcriptional LysR family regulator
MLSLVTEMNDTILDMVLNRKLDGGFISSPGEHPSLNEVFLKKEELILVGGTETLWENAEDILREAPLITFPPDSIFRRRFELLLSSQGCSYGNRMTIINSLAPMIVNIISGLGYGYLPRSIVQPYIEKGVMKSYMMDDPYAMLDIVFVYRRDHVMSAAMRYFIEMLT